MKTLNLFTTFCFALLFSSIGFAQGIDGTAHDFSTESFTTEVCNVCHTPHNAKVVTDSPLWDHEVTVATFTLYTSSISSSMDAVTGQPDGASKLCLSCHDGTVAVDNFATESAGTTMISTGLVGTDLSNDHPVSFTYDATLASTDGGLFDPSSVTTSLGGTIDADLLRLGKVQCSSCHDVHDAAGNTNLLVISNVNSALCLTCHDK